MCESASPKVGGSADWYSRLQYWSVMYVGINGSNATLSDRLGLVINGEVSEMFASAAGVATNGSVLPANFTPVPVHLSLNSTATHKVRWAHPTST